MIWHFATHTSQTITRQQCAVTLAPAPGGMKFRRLKICARSAPQSTRNIGTGKGGQIFLIFTRNENPPRKHPPLRQNQDPSNPAFASESEARENSTEGWAVNFSTDELKRILAANPALSIGDPGATPKLEPNPRNAPLGAKEIQGPACERVLVRIESVRTRLIDEDNLCEKYHVDLCRYAGIIADDSPDKVKIQVSQRKAKKGEGEKVVIEIFEAQEHLREGMGELTS